MFVANMACVALMDMLDLDITKELYYVILTVDAACLTAGLLGALVWVALGENIHVLLAVEENTRETVSLLRSQR